MKKIATLILAAAPLCIGAQEIVAPPAVLSAAGGRYVFGQVGPARADQYLLDTTTGRLWRLVCISRDSANACQGVALEIVLVADGGVIPPSSPPKR